MCDQKEEIFLPAGRQVARNFQNLGIVSGYGACPPLAELRFERFITKISIFWSTSFRLTKR